MKPDLTERDDGIYRLYEQGMTATEISRKIGLSQNRVHSIIQSRRDKYEGPAPIAIADGVLVRLYEITKISPAQLRERNRIRKLARVRQVAMYAIKRRTPWSFPQVAKYLGMDDHTTVMHGCRKIESLLKDCDPWLDMVVSAALTAKPVMPLMLDQHIAAVDAHNALLEPVEQEIEIEPELEPENLSDPDPDASYRLSMQLSSSQLLTSILRYFVQRRRAA